MKTKIPDFDVAAAIAGEFAIGVALIGGGGAHVVMNFAARTAGTGIAHRPEIFLEAGNFDDAIFRRADFVQSLRGFVIGRQILPGPISAPPNTVK